MGEITEIMEIRGGVDTRRWSGAKKELLDGLLDLNPKSRLAWKTVLQNKWFDILARDTPSEQTAKQKLQEQVNKGKERMPLLLLIGQQLQGEDLKYYSSYWRAYDKSFDGVLQKREFERITNGLYGNREMLFQMADVDEDGEISFDEFVALMLDLNLLTPEKKSTYLRQAFAALADKKGDYISCESFVSYIQSAGAEKLFRQIAQTDEKIDFEEFPNMCRACRSREGFGDGGDWLVPVASSSSMMSYL